MLRGSAQPSGPFCGADAVSNTAFATQNGRRLGAALLAALCVGASGCLQPVSLDALGFRCHQDAECDEATRCVQGFCAPPDAGTRDAGPPQVGVPPGTVLNPLQGDQSFVTDGQVIEAKDITGCVTIAASNITVRKSRITCNGFYGITIRPPATGTRVEDVELRGTTADAFVAFEGAEATLSRVDIHGFKRALDLSSNVTVEASSIHDLLGDGAAAVGCAGGTGLHLRNNRIDRGPASGVGPALRFQTDNGPLSDVWLEANFLNGGPYTLEVVERANGAVTGLHVLRNRFGRDFVDGPLHLGGIAAAVDVSGNVFDDTGEAVP